MLCRRDICELSRAALGRLEAHATGGIYTTDADADLAKLVESSLYDYEPNWNPPGLHLVDRPDLLMSSTSSPERGANRVARTRWTEAEAEKRTDEVLAHFHDRNRAFTWCVGPSSRPADLDRRLEARGLVPIHVDLMLTAELPVTGPRTNRQVRIEDVRDETGVLAFLRISQGAHSDWSEEEFQASIAARLSYVRLPARRGGMLLAYLGGELAGNASWRDSADGRSLHLTGAHTDLRFRNQGVYSTLVASRTEEARRRNCKLAIVRATPETSAPILVNRGFRNRGTLPIYALPKAL